MTREAVEYGWWHPEHAPHVAHGPLLSIKEAIAQFGGETRVRRVVIHGWERRDTDEAERPCDVIE